MDFYDIVERIDVFYVVSQVFALLGTIFSLMAVQQRKKVQILKLNTFATIFASLHYLFLGAWSGMTTKIVSTARNGIAAYEASKNKTSKLFPLFFSVFYVIVGILSFESAVSLLPIVASVAVTIAAYMLDASRIRKVHVLGSVMWLIYNAAMLSIVGVISEIIYLMNLSVALYRYRKKPAKRRKSAKQQPQIGRK